MATFKRINGDYTIKTLNSSDTVTLQTASTVITGDLTVQGNATLTGNINADRIFSGSSSVEIPTPGGNVAISVGGTSNVAVFSNSALSVSGNVAGNYILGNGSQLTGVTATVIGVVPLLSVTGNVDAGNLRTAGVITAAGNVTGGNIATAGNISAQGTVEALQVRSDLVGSVFADDSSLIVDAVDNHVFTNAVTVAGEVLAQRVRSDLIGSVFADDSSLIVDAIDNRIFTNSVSALGNVVGGNVITAGTITATGNIATSGTFLGNFAGNITGNLAVPGSNTQVIFNNSGSAGASAAFTFDSSSNVVTVGGTVSSTGNISAAGNITAGNVLASANVNATTHTGTTVSVTGNITGGNIVSNSVVAGELAVTASNVTFALSGNVNLGTRYINNVGSPTQALDAATKQYVDDLVSSGITIHTPVRVESPTALTATYAQGGNVYTVTDTVANSTVVFSTAANLQVNDQLWFSNSFQGIQANTAYFVVSAPNTSAAVLSTSYSGPAVSNITSAAGLTESVRVNSGIGATLTNAGANAALTIDGITLSVSDRVLIYQQANAAHNGVYVVSNVGNATVAWVMTRSSDMDRYIPNDINGIDSGDYFFVQEGNTGEAESYVMTAPTGPVILGYDGLTFTQFSASKAYQAGDGLTLTGTTFSVNVDNDTTAIVADIVVVKSGANLVTPNIGNATGNSLTLTGNGTVSATVVTATGNVSGGNVLTAGVVSATGNITAGNVSATNLTGTLATAAQTNITSVGILTSLSVSGNVDGGNLRTAGVVSATGNVTGNFFVGNGSLLTGVVATGIGTLSSLSVSGNIDTGNLRTAGVVSATGNVTGSQFNGSGAGLTAVPGANVTGTVANATFATTASSATTATTVTGAAQANITSVGTLTALSVSGNIDGGNLRTTGSISAAGNTTSGNVSVGVGTVSVGNIVNTNANGVGNIGSSTTYYNTVFAKATSAQYADLAEMYSADAEYEPGTVLRFGGSREVTVCTRAADPRVAGVVSKEPAYVMNSGLGSEFVAVVALTGRVHTRVVGPVAKGDMMVSAGNGCAQACATPAMGTVIGKSLVDFTGSTGIIEIVIGRV